MSDLVKLDDEVITTEDFVKLLKFTGAFEGLLEDIVKDKLSVHAAKRAGVEITPEELQERADQFRRVKGLHRAVDMNRYLDSTGLSLDDFERYLTEMLYHEKITETIGSDEAVDEYFNLNAPRFDSIEVSHIVVDSEGKAREIVALLEDDPDSFADLAHEHSLADTREEGGYVGRVLRGSLRSDVEAKVFNAAEGELLGPFPSADESYFEIFRVNAKTPAALTEDTVAEVRRLLQEEWIAARAREHNIEIF
ncbi:MAG: peptidylprolyl isomerase [Gammaproteobacteria bacterium]|jgi:peptidylprolyl isomerase